MVKNYKKGTEAAASTHKKRIHERNSKSEEPPEHQGVSFRLDGATSSPHETYRWPPGDRNSTDTEFMRSRRPPTGTSGSMLPLQPLYIVVLLKWESNRTAGERQKEL